MDASEITTETTVVRDPVCGMTVDPAAGKPRPSTPATPITSAPRAAARSSWPRREDYIEATDPVCGMKVDRATARHLARHDGARFYFCSARCKEKFEAAPERLSRRPGRRPSRCRRARSTPARCIPRSSDGPGACPICGMALEPMGVPAGDEGPNPELVDFSRRFSVSAALTVPLLVIAMGPMLGLPVAAWIGERTARWLELVLATPVVLWAAGRSWCAAGARSAPCTPTCGR